MKHSVLNKLHTQVKRRLAGENKQLSKLVKFQILDVGEQQLVALIIGDLVQGLMPVFKELELIIAVYQAEMKVLGLKSDDVAAVAVPAMIQFKVKSTPKFDYLDVVVGAKSRRFTYRPSLGDLKAAAELVHRAMAGRLRDEQIKVRPIK